MSDSKNETIDYSDYSLDELKQAYASLDKHAFPKRAQTLYQLIQSKQNSCADVSLVKDDSIVGKVRVIFHGTGTEYFAIWIVNLLLSIVTLGIYSAWATVRTNRYFYSNTEVAGHRLAYLATPMQILIGRLIAFGLFVVFIAVSTISPMFYGVAFFVFFALLPIVIVMGVRFRMRMMAYRNVRFNFKINYGRAYLIFFFLPILAIITLYLALPWVLKKMDEFIYENISFGDKEFMPSLKAGEYYIAAIVAAVIGIIGLFIFGMVAGFGALVGADAGGYAGAMAGFSVAGVLGFLFYILVLVIAVSFYQAYVRNHVYNNMKVDQVAIFSSDLKVMDLVFLSITNFLMLAFTLGLAFPWVKVRTTRLLTSATEITILSGINNVVAKSGGNESAIADEVIGAFDVDVSIG